MIKCIIEIPVETNEKIHRLKNLLSAIEGKRYTVKQVYIRLIYKALENEKLLQINPEDLK